MTTKTNSSNSFNERVRIRFWVDDLEVSSDYVMKMMNPSDVAQVDHLGGTIVFIHTKRGKFIPKETPYIKHFINTLGFQKPAEFYAPKYETPAENVKPDLRTTIHWQPNITTDEHGKASFSFYTANAPATYTVVIEGVTADGKIMYKRDKIVVK